MLYATGSGVRIHYQVEGSGAPLVLHTGFAGSVIDFYDAGYVDALKGKNTLVLIDLRGQGDSDKPHEAAAYAPAELIPFLSSLGLVLCSSREVHTPRREPSARARIILQGIGAVMEEWSTKKTGRRRA